MYFGGIEAGGTKFNCIVVDENRKVFSETIIPTTTPKETLNEVFNFFSGYKLEYLGLACFGPINLDENSIDYGKILNTPKLEWQNFNIYQSLKELLNTEVFFDTDVALAGYAEYLNDLKYNNIIYITIGTGIGAAIIKDGEVIIGNSHSEMGHVRVTRYKDDKFPSTCPYHDNCLEGLASGKSLSIRYNLNFEEMSRVDEIWDMEGYYIASGFYNYILTFAPDIIYIGGGVSNQDKLIPEIIKHLKNINNNYIDIDRIIIKKANLDKSGLVGAYEYAIRRSQCTQK